MQRKKDPIRILAIPGSLRKKSYNKSLLIEAAELAPEGVSISVFETLDEVPVFNEDVADVKSPSGVVELRRALVQSDGLLIATPEYNQAVPGVVKNMIDWLSIGGPDEGLEGKPVAVTGVTTGPWGTRLAQTMLRQMLASTQAVLLPDPTLFLRNAESLFDGDGNLVDATTRQRVGELVSALASWIQLLNPPTAVMASLNSDNSRQVLVPS
ncbi:MAG: NAD(P)H-dependent oxidoreductase [Acidimicrobiia bacterium]|nr:NAD(P)H-dependent oxidoreductase [Acidimicrobiia bacterium]